MFSVDFQGSQKLTDNFRKIIAHEFHEKHFLKFSENFDTILVNVRCQFYLAAESIGQDSAILHADQPIKLRESRAG